MSLKDTEVTRDFFRPLLPIHKGRPLCGMFLVTWQNFMSKLPDDDADCWMPRILEVVVADCDETQESIKHSARVATSIVAWFGTISGQVFLKDLTARLVKNPTRREALCAWAVENAIATGIEGNGGRILHSIVQDRNIAKNARPQPLTEVETDTAETLMTWLATPNGRRLLSLLKKTSRRFEALDDTKKRKLMEESLK